MSKPVTPDSSRYYQELIPIGIDFGTTNSTMSRYCNSMLANGPISYNFPITGSIQYPSMALLDSESQTIRTGNAAYTHRLTDPENVVLSVKRKILEYDTYLLGNRYLSNADIVESIISGFLSEIKLTDHNINPGVVTLTVPYYFGENENSLILDAAKKALVSQWGFTSEIFLLPEPVAASLASIYSMRDRELSSQIFFIFDIGGGTLDITIVRITSNSSKFEYEVLANDGISKFGGDDIDELIYNYVVKHEKLDFSSLNKHTRILNRARILEECKEAKHQLTFAESYSFMCPNIEGVERSYIEFDLSRAILNSIIAGQQGGSRNMVSEITDCVNRLYFKAGINPDSVNYIVPVGGTSYIPLFRGLIRQIHQNAIEICNANMMDNFVLVANGASIYSAMKCDKLHKTKYYPFKHNQALEKMVTRVSHSLFLEKYNGCLDIIVEANSISPAVIQKRYYPTKYNNDGRLVDIGRVNLYQGIGYSRKNKQFIGAIDFTHYEIYSHSRELDDIPIYIKIEATDTLVTVSCRISKGSGDGRDIVFQQIIHK